MKNICLHCDDFYTSLELGYIVWDRKVGGEETFYIRGGSQSTERYISYCPFCGKKLKQRSLDKEL